MTICDRIYFTGHREGFGKVGKKCVKLCFWNVIDGMATCILSIQGPSFSAKLLTEKTS